MGTGISSKLGIGRSSQPPSAVERIESYVRRCNAGEFPGEHMVRRLVQYYVACELGLIIIRDQHAEHVPLRLNEIQCRAHAAALDQAAQGVPIRLSILKSRKGGISTWSETLAVFLCACYRHQRALTIAHEGRGTQEIFEIAQRAAENFRLVPCKVTSEIDWPETDSHYHAMTAGGTAVGSGGTPSFLHLSEGPKWEKNKDANYTSASNSVPFIPETIIIHEFTANGREKFYSNFDQARNDPDYPYFAIFIAWYLDDRCVAPAPFGFERDPEEDDIARSAMKDNGVEISDEQLQWRRIKIKDDGIGNFRQEYPSTPEEAIQGAKGLIFPHMRDALVSELPFDPKQVPWSERVGSIDFGYKDPTCIWTGFYVDQELWITDFWRRQETLADDQVEGCHQGHHYFCDPANLTERKALILASQAAGQQCRFSAAPRRKNPGEDTARVEMQHVMKMLAEGRLHIMYNVAAQLIVECDTLAWNEVTGKPDDRRTEECAHFDAVKSLTYLVMGVMNRKVDEQKPPATMPLSRRQQFQGF